ncbi:MAG: CGLD27 family protein [Microcoleaceae cyanobacterium]
MRKTSASICPVPLEQRPVNEYMELREAWLFSWVTLDWGPYLKKLVWVWVLSWIVCGPLAAASFSPREHLLQFLLAAGGGSSFVLTLFVIRLHLGWTYVQSRLKSPTVFYEESGWYDGQTWVKTPEFLAQDQLILSYQVQPLLQRLQKTLCGLALFLVTGGLSWLGSNLR